MAVPLSDGATYRSESEKRSMCNCAIANAELRLGSGVLLSASKNSSQGSRHWRARTHFASLQPVLRGSGRSIARLIVANLIGCVDPASSRASDYFGREMAMCRPHTYSCTPRVRSRAILEFSREVTPNSPSMRSRSQLRDLSLRCWMEGMTRGLPVQRHRAR